ncbi:MAG: ornithine cyclodeaminase [bacterium]|nr:ornithine cyclodeaminase [bacterium]
MLHLSAADLRQALPMAEAIVAMRDAYAALSSGTGSVPQRASMQSEKGVTLLMGASFPSLGLATKIVSVFPDAQPAIRGLVLVLDPETGAVRATIDGAALTAIRTGAASGVATELLAPARARVGCVVGNGVQARTQAIAIDTARELDRILVVGRDPERVARFIDATQPDVRAVLEPSGAPRDADVICLATSSHTPVIDGTTLRPGTHVNAVGSFTLEMREADVATIRRARIFVDQIEAALEEAGELVHALEAGETRAEDWTELGAVIDGDASGRSSAEEVTFFKSVGHAAQDVAAGARAYENALRMGLGTKL